MSLAEKWAPLLKGCDARDADALRMLTAAMLEREADWLKKQTEVGAFEKFAFPLIRAASPMLRAADIVSVQPMTSPVGGFKPKKTPLLELTERIWAEKDETDDNAEPTPNLDVGSADHR